jgi:hypothetical protein
MGTAKHAVLYVRVSTNDKDSSRTSYSPSRRPGRWSAWGRSWRSYRDEGISGTNGLGWMPDPQFVELFSPAFDDRDLGDPTPCRSVRPFYNGNIQTRRLMSGSRRVIAARPSI